MMKDAALDLELIEYEVENPNCRRIFSYIAEQPGTNFSQIMNRLGLGNGTVTYHLGNLMKKKLVRAESDGYRTRFYSNGHESSSKNSTPKQQEVLDIITRNPSISNPEIAKKLGKTRHSVMYHTKNLSREGWIRSKVINRKFEWYINKRKLR